MVPVDDVGAEEREKPSFCTQMRKRGALAQRPEELADDEELGVGLAVVR
jgi:hypothetical protein